VVAFATETYYGLAVDPFNASALERLFRIKRRSKELPILVLVSGRAHVDQVVDQMPASLDRLADFFWPGPLTLVCPARATVPPLLTGNTGTVGVRWSPSTTANRLIAAFDGPITATSANRSGAPAAVSAAEVARIFDDEVDLILDGGQTPGGSGSTLVGLRGNTLICLREGKIPFTAVQACTVSESQTSDNHTTGGTYG
jgi:L-threonylcarbamoyladenylate synthase